MTDHFRRSPSLAHLDALDLQLELIRFWKGAWGPRYATGFLESSRRGVPDDIKQKPNPIMELLNEGTLTGHQMAERNAFFLNQSDTFFVTRAMTELAEVRAEEIEPQILQPLHLPSPNGFCLLGKSIIRPDINGKPITYRAFSWSTIEYRYVTSNKTYRGVQVLCYTDIADDEAADHDLWIPQLRKMEEVSNHGIPQLILLGEDEWAFGSTYIKVPDKIGGMAIDGDEARLPYELYMNRQLWAAIWDMMREVVTVTRSDMPRPVWRRGLAALGYIPEIRVVTLRKARYDSKGKLSDSPIEVEWSHRWIVKSHPRTITHKDGTKEVIQIKSYIKGPEYLPLVEKDTIYRVER